VLGVAGLLNGRRATTHWAYAELLPLVGATHEKARIVKDGNVITAGGVTSGIDFGLNVVAEIAGETVAQAIQWELSTIRLRHLIAAIPIEHRRLSKPCSPPVRKRENGCSCRYLSLTDTVRCFPIAVRVVARMESRKRIEMRLRSAIRVHGPHKSGPH